MYINKNATQLELEELLNSSNSQIVIDTLLFITFNVEDWKWVQEKCIKLLDSNNVDIRGLALTCLGHIARIHNKIEKHRVLSILKKKLMDDSIKGRVQDAIDDIEMFT